MADSSFRADEAHRFDFEHQGIRHPVYRDGSGPPVLLLHELPGMTPEFIRLAGLIKDAGFRVYCPLFFGRPGHKIGLRDAPGVARLCVRREFRLLATHDSGPIAEWLRALCRQMRDETGSAGVGAIGMCMTGNVVLALMADDAVLAPVTCQPSLPLPVVVAGKNLSRQKRKEALGISPDELRAAKRRAAASPILGYRFDSDPICPAERFRTLEREFGAGFRGKEIPTGPGSPGDIPPDAHSVLTQHFVNRPGHPTRQALDEILEHFRERLT